MADTVEDPSATEAGRAGRPESEELLRALQRERAARARAELLHEVAAATSGEKDLARILGIALERLRAHVPFTGGSIALVEGDVLRIRAAVGPFAEEAVGDALPRGRGRSWRLVESMQPLLSGDIARDGITPADGRRPIRSFLAVPLTWQGEGIGLLEIDSLEPEVFDEDDLRLLQGLATVVTGTVELARRYDAEVRALEAEHRARESAERAAARTALLQRVTAALSDALTTEAVADVVLQTGLGALGASAGVFVVREGDELQALRWVGYEDEAVGRWQRFGIDLDNPISEAVRTGEPVLLRSLEDVDGRFAVLGDEMRRRGNRSWAALPLKVEDRVTGALAAAFQREHNFPPVDREFMLTLARQAAQALERARLHEAEALARAESESAQRRLAFIAQANSLLVTSVDHETTLQRIAELSVPGLADACAIHLVDPDGGPRLVAHAEMDADHAQALLQAYEWWRQTMGDDAPARALLLAPIAEILGPAGGDDRASRGVVEHGYDASIAAPLVTRGRTVGVLTLASRSRRRYGRPDLALAEELARSAAAAVESRRLFREAQEAERAKDESLALLDVLLATAPVGMGFWDRELRYVRVNEALANINGLPVEAHIGRSIMELLPGLPASVAEDYRNVLETGQPVLNREVSGETPAAPGQERHWLTSYYPVPGPTGAPIGIGAIVTEITERKRAEQEREQLFRQREDALLRERLARAIAEEAQRRLGFLAEASLAINSALSVYDRVAIITEQAREIIGANASSTSTSVSLGREVIHVTSLSEEYQSLGLSALGARMPAALARVRAGGNPVRLDRAGLERELGAALPADAVPARSWLAVPLADREGRGIGLLQVADKVEGDFTPTDEAVAVQLAQMAAVAIDNVRLYEDARVAEQRVALLADASAVLAASLDVDRSLQGVAELAVPAIADACVVEVVEPEGDVRLAAVAHVDPGALAVLRDTWTRSPFVASEDGTGERAEPRPSLHADVTDAVLASLARDEEHLAGLRGLGARSLISVPLRVQDRVLGSLTLVQTRSARPFAAADLALAEDLARRAALALDTARVYRELSRFKSTVDTTLDPVFMFDPATLRFFYVNQGAIDSVGYSREDLLRMTPLDLKREFDERRYRALLAPLLNGVRPSLTFTTTHRRRDGTTFPVEVFLQYVAPPGEPGRMVASVRDITERVEARARLQRLAQSERSVSAELRSIIRAMGEAVLVFGPDGSIVLANPAADALFAGVTIRRYDDLLALTPAPDEMPRLGSHAPQGPFEVPTRGTDPVWLEVSSYPVLPPGESLRAPAADGGQPIETILLIRDVTQARRLRMARDAYIGVLSHELRTPVTTIYGNAKLLGNPERVLAPELREEALADIETEAERLYRLVEDLLVLARFSQENRGEFGLALEPLLLQRIVPNVIASEGRRWPGVEFEVTIPQGLPAVQGDPTYVEQVLRNLFSNAAKYSGSGTRVRVAVEDAGGQVLVRVRDQGPGFAPEDAGRLFELFYRAPHTATTASGAGIGLYVCRRLVETMGGRMWATPAPEGGAEFGFSINVFTEEGP